MINLSTRLGQREKCKNMREGGRGVLHKQHKLLQTNTRVSIGPEHEDVWKYAISKPWQPWSYRKLTTKRLICFLLFDQTAQTISARDKQLRESELNGADDITTPASSQSMVGNYNYSGSASDSHRDAGCNNNPFILLQTPPSHPKLSNFTRDNMFVFY